MSKKVLPKRKRTPRVVLTKSSKSCVTTIPVPSKLEEILQRMDATLDLLQLRIGELEKAVRGVDETVMDIGRTLIGPPPMPASSDIIG